MVDAGGREQAGNSLQLFRQWHTKMHWFLKRHNVGTFQEPPTQRGSPDFSMVSTTLAQRGSAGSPKNKSDVASFTQNLKRTTTGGYHVANMVR